MQILIYLFRFSQQSQRGNVKSLLEIQAEEAKKVMQREQIKQQQYRQQQQQQQQVCPLLSDLSFNS